MTKKYERRDLTNEMRKMFAHFDLDKSGKISANELRESMGKLGMTLSVPESKYEIPISLPDSLCTFDIGRTIFKREGAGNEERGNKS